MAPSPPEIIDLVSSSDEDEDLKRAIAMSLDEESGPAETPAKSQEHVPQSPISKSLPTEPPVAPGLTAFGSVLLDRKKMEEERRARIAKRKRPEDSSPEREAPIPRRPRVTGVTSPRNRASQGPKTAGYTTNPPSSTVPPSTSLPFPKGAVKRTWASGYERRGDDIKIEEVFQREQLKLAVLASYQWDDDWLLSKIDITQTRLVCIAYASDEAHKDQMRANVPSSHVRFCFPPMNGYGAMHTKLQLLKFPDYLRIVVPSGNLTSYDWGETGVLENMVFLIDLPHLGGDASFQHTLFSTELFRFLQALGLDDKLVSSLEKYDFTETKRYGFVHTIAGSHSGDDWKNTGYSGLARIVDNLGLAFDGPIDVDFVCSSLGNLKREFLSSLYAALQGKSGDRNTDALIVRTLKARPKSDEDLLADRLRVYFPSQRTVSSSRGGPASAGTIAFQSAWWEASTFPREILRDCVCKRRGLLIHSKVIFVRHAPSDGAPPASWAYIGSANLSESAWGRLVKDKSSKRPKLTCRNWECGVVFSVPSPDAGGGAGGGASADGETMGLEELFGGHIPIPMETPAATYNSAAPDVQPWFLR